MEVKVLGPDFEKMIITPGVYIIELEFLKKPFSCMLMTEKVARNHYGHRIRIQIDEKDIEYCVDRIQYSDLQFIKINNREYYLADYQREMCTDIMNLTYVCFDAIKHIRKKGE